MDTNVQQPATAQLVTFIDGRARHVLPELRALGARFNELKQEVICPTPEIASDVLSELYARTRTHELADPETRFIAAALGAIAKGGGGGFDRETNTWFFSAAPLLQLAQRALTEAQQPSQEQRNSLRDQIALVAKTHPERVEKTLGFDPAKEPERLEKMTRTEHSKALTTLYSYTTEATQKQKDYLKDMLESGALDRAFGGLLDKTLIDIAGVNFVKEPDKFFAASISQHTASQLLKTAKPYHDALAPGMHSLRSQSRRAEGDALDISDPGRAREREFQQSTVQQQNLPVTDKSYEKKDHDRKVQFGFAVDVPKNTAFPDLWTRAHSKAAEWMRFNVGGNTEDAGVIDIKPMSGNRIGPFNGQVIARVTEPGADGALGYYVIGKPNSATAYTLDVRHVSWYPAMLGEGSKVTLNFGKMVPEKIELGKDPFPVNAKAKELREDKAFRLPENADNLSLYADALNEAAKHLAEQSSTIVKTSHIKHTKASPDDNGLIAGQVMGKALMEHEGNVKGWYALREGTGKELRMVDASRVDADLPLGAIVQLNTSHAVPTNVGISDDQYNALRAVPADVQQQAWGKDLSAPEHRTFLQNMSYFDAKKMIESAKQYDPIGTFRDVATAAMSEKHGVNARIAETPLVDTNKPGSFKAEIVAIDALNPNLFAIDRGFGKLSFVDLSKLDGDIRVQVGDKLEFKSFKDVPKAVVKNLSQAMDGQSLTRRMKA